MTNATFSLYQQMYSYVFAQHQSFDDDADVIIAGIPFDLATSGRPGARFAPTSIRSASSNLGWEHRRHPWAFSLRDNLKIADIGDLGFAHGDARGAMNAVREHVARVLKKGAIPFMLGGDHLITLPALQSVAETHGPVALVHFDAHTDDYSGGSEFDHGSVFYHAHSQGLLQADKVIQLGIRTDHDLDGPFTVVTADQLWHANPKEVAARIRSHIGDAKVYLTFDIDCFDPIYAPGTGTPVSGGVSGPFILELIRHLQGLNWVGMDVVEVSPPYDNAQITSLLAATLMTDMMHLLACKLHPELMGEHGGLAGQSVNT
ncbi:agmatinase [Aliiglaciecola sp. CAU 1673]|uniref:agmatinase n=1 Tax=Aliiglaciecola sp. CAU 1673 TaxID=3032595 RepID=UPI0023DA08A3|nr:agmatinase [Aliiglaciecola sp. CAU 1673]MDF2177061.1 agmatinase [Aliiglaciecola sp. CAU 1673]